jgi:hypothetical protein
MTTGPIARPGGATRKDPPVVTVFRTHDGSLSHARCARTLGYLGARNGFLELDFYCQTCHEHVTLPQSVVSRMLEGESLSRHLRQRPLAPAATSRSRVVAAR